MSQQVMYSCDRCGKTAAEDVVRRSWIEVAFSRALTAGNLAVDGGHVCDECLPVFADFLAKTPRERVGAFATHASELEISCDVRVASGCTASFSDRAQHAFSPDQFVILDRPEDWIVHGITIGNRAQFNQAGDLPGDMFAEGAVAGPFAFETIQTVMDVTVTVTYRGKDPEGACFRSKFVGRRAGFAPDPSKMRPSKADVALHATPRPPSTTLMLGEFAK